MATGAVHRETWRAFARRIAKEIRDGRRKRAAIVSLSVHVDGSKLAEAVTVSAHALEQGAVTTRRLNPTLRNTWD